MNTPKRLFYTAWISLILSLAVFGPKAQRGINGLQMAERKIKTDTKSTHTWVECMGRGECTLKYKNNNIVDFYGCCYSWRVRVKVVS